MTEKQKMSFAITEASRPLAKKMTRGLWVTPLVTGVLCLYLTLSGTGVTANSADLYRITTCLNPNFDPTTIAAFYGCYCGPGGQGTPVDAIDRCCQVHDNCYQRFEAQKGCMWYWPVYTSISYVCNNETKKITCRDENLCRKSQCVCDEEFSQCLHRLNATTPTSRPKCKDYFRSNKFDFSWFQH